MTWTFLYCLQIKLSTNCILNFFCAQERQGIFFERPVDRIHLPDPAEVTSDKLKKRWENRAAFYFWICFAFGVGFYISLPWDYLHYYTMILQRIRILVEDAGFELRNLVRSNEQLQLMDIFWLINTKDTLLQYINYSYIWIMNIG